MSGDGRYVVIRPDAPAGLNPRSLQLVTDAERGELRSRLAEVIAGIRAQHADCDMDVSLDSGETWREVPGE